MGSKFFRDAKRLIFIVIRLIEEAAWSDGILIKSSINLPWLFYRVSFFLELNVQVFEKES